MRRDWIISVVLLLLLAALFVISLLAGRILLPIGEVWDGLWSLDPGSKGANLAATIVTQLRLPRAILALEVGGALGVAGAAVKGGPPTPRAAAPTFGGFRGGAPGL